jgi:hypothetical protein
MSSELIQLWKIICHRDLPELAEKWIASDKMPLLTIDTTVAFPVFMVIILFSLFFYIYLYVQAMKGKFGYIRGMEWLFDSVSFWLQIRTPTMKGFGGGKIKGKGKGGKRK